MANYLPGGGLKSPKLHPEKWQLNHRKDLDKNMKPEMMADFSLLETSTDSGLPHIENSILQTHFKGIQGF